MRQELESDMGGQILELVSILTTGGASLTIKGKIDILCVNDVRIEWL